MSLKLHYTQTHWTNSEEQCDRAWDAVTSITAGYSMHVIFWIYILSKKLYKASVSD